MASWARRVAADPNGTTSANVDGLRDAGLDDATIFAVTAFVALRLAFSTVNDALGAVPDTELWANAPSAVADVVTWGR
jgi:alkylhydroperoxidase family enzyme